MSPYRKIQFGIAIPQMFPDKMVDVGVIFNGLKEAESLGYDSAWAQDQVVGRTSGLYSAVPIEKQPDKQKLTGPDSGPMPILDPLILLAYSAAVTQKIKLGISVLVLPLRSPVLLAKELATLDHLTGGRLIVGVGLGELKELLPAFGYDTEHRVSRFEEGLQLMKRLWMESDVTVNSPFWKLQNITVEPKPRQNPHPPIMFGGRTASSLRRAVKMGDGWMGGGTMSMSKFKELIHPLHKYLDERRREASTFFVAKRVYIAVDKDKSRASDLIGRWFYQYYRNAPLGLETSIIGDEAECAEKLSELAGLGLDMMLLNPVYDYREQTARLARDVLPRL